MKWKIYLISFLLFLAVGVSSIYCQDYSERTDDQILNQLTENLNEWEKSLDQREKNLNKREDSLNERENLIEKRESLSTMKENWLVSLEGYWKNYKEDSEGALNSEFWKGFLIGGLTGLVIGETTGIYLGVNIRL